MANNEIPRWAQAALERNERIQSKARSAVALMKLLEEQDRLSRLAPDTLGTVDPNYSEEVRYEAPGAIMDPESWLNRGLGTLAGNAADVILGRPSENPVVDYGVANIPGVGAAAILGAGGMPGIVDAVGAGALKNLKKIPKYTLDFVTEFFGEKGLRNLDNALTKYPKADKPSVNDAVEILRGGYGGEKVLPLKPYRSENPYRDYMKLTTTEEFGDDNELQDGVYQYLKHLKSNALNSAVAKMENSKDIRWPYAKKYLNGILSSLENGNINTALEYQSALVELSHVEKKYLAQMDKQADRFVSNAEKGYANKDDLPALVKVAKFYTEQHPQADDVAPFARRINELEISPTQDWETIIRKQELKDARDAEKEAKKAAKKAQEELKKASSPETPKVEPVAPKEEPVVVPEPVAAPEEPVAVPEVPKGGPNRWEENGWTSKDVNPALFEKYGKNLNEKSKRDAFVADSLAKHWANQLMTRPGFAAEEILDNLDRANARHTFTNYDEVSHGFSDDIVRNLNSGNMPGTAVQLLQRYKNNVRVPGKTVPTMVLGIEERPKIYTNPRIWPDMAEGVDLYELLFRPMIDRKLNEINPNYWTY